MSSWCTRVLQRVHQRVHLRHGVRRAAAAARCGAARPAPRSRAGATRRDTASVRPASGDEHDAERGGAALPDQQVHDEVLDVPPVAERRLVLADLQGGVAQGGALGLCQPGASGHGAHPRLASVTNRERDAARRVRRPGRRHPARAVDLHALRRWAACCSARSRSPTPGCSAGRPTTSCCRPSRTATIRPGGLLADPGAVRGGRDPAGGRHRRPPAGRRRHAVPACRRTTAATSPGSTSGCRCPGTSSTRPASCSPTPTPTSRPPGRRSRRCRWRSARSR